MALVAATVTAGAAPAADGVTLQLQRIYQPGNFTTRFRFSGTIASGQAGEYVAVLRHWCGSAHPTAIAGATTVGGGRWEAESAGYGAKYDSSTYQARWGSRLSEPLVFRGRVQLSLAPLSGSRYRVTVNSLAQSMNGKRIELQRRVGGAWQRAGAATLRGRANTFTATVVARGRNVTYRVHVPPAAARPCYVATSTDPFVVGRPAPPGSSLVVDRTFSCAAEVTGGLRMITIGASSGRAAVPTAGESVSVTTNFVPDWTLVSASPGVVQFNPKRCTANSARPALSAAGLRGGTVDADGRGRRFDCETSTRVLVRVRATFAAPTTFQANRDFGYVMQQARGAAREVSLVVLTPAGKRLAFAGFAGGKGRLFTAPGCVEDD
jgi:hypothetical protein